MSKIRANLVVKGKVQKVAFRQFVEDLAREYRLFGFVENIDNYDRDVLIVCEGEDQKIREFIERLKNLREEDREKTLAQITEVIPEFKLFEGKFDNFKLVRGKHELDERLEEGLLLIKWEFKKQDKNFFGLGEKIDNGFNKLGESSAILADKVDKGFSKLGEHSDILADKVDKGFSKLGEHSDILADKVDKGFSKLGESSAILADKVDNGFNKLDKHFGVMDNRFVTLEMMLILIPLVLIVSIVLFRLF